jgi:uncharacterized phage protein (TIGR02220 family)
MINIDDRLIELVPAKQLKLLLKIASYMGKNRFAFPSIKTLATKLKWNEKTVRKHIYWLDENGFIEIKERRKPDGAQTSNGYIIKTKLIGYFVNLQGLGIEESQEKNPSQKVVGGPSQKVVDEVLTNEHNYIVEKPKGIIDDVKEVVNYLNEQSGSAYRHTTKKTQAQIKARMKEGFTVEDFKKAIRHKVRDWKGTPMQKYLRPETLFGAKFESYLQEAEAIEKLQTSQTIEEQYKQGYNAYLDWMKKDFPELVARVQYLSPKEYKSYWLDDYLKNAAMVGRAKKRRILQDCHKQFVVNPNVQRNYETVWGYYCQQIKQHIKSASVC